MNTLKKSTIFLLLGMSSLSMLMNGCTKQEKEKEKEEITVNVTSVDEAEDKEADEVDKEEKEAVGTLVDASMNTITIRQNDGTELTFLSNNCEHNFKNGLREGNWIVVTYTGEIQGDNTQNASVIKITDNDENKIEKTKKAMKIGRASCRERV